MKSIQTKLTVIILLIFLVAMSTLGGLNYWKARGIITENITISMQKEAVKSAQDMNEWLKARKMELTMLASNPVMQGGNLEEIMPVLAAAQNTNKTYEGIVYADRYGMSCSATGFKVSVADKLFFKQAMQGESFVANPATSRQTGKLIATVAVPVKSNGNVVGVLFGPMSMEELTKKVLDIKVGQTGYAYVLQEDGLAIFHPDQEIAMKYNALKDEKTPQMLRSFTEHIVKGETGVGNYDYDSTNKLVAFAPVPEAKWFLAISVPTSEIFGAVSTLTLISTITILVVLVLAAIVIVWLARRIALPIQKLDSAAKRVAEGDISQVKFTIASNDEIGRLGQSFEQMVKNLRNLLQKINNATEHVAASSEELTASSEQSSKAASQIAESITTMAAGASEQMSLANNTIAVVEQMSSGIQHMAANANQLADYSAQADQKAKKGYKTVEEAVEQMGKIQMTVTDSAQVVAKLGERSKEIGQIVDTISGIAGQTNLLALNAAIEAARAGEQGRGFSVVADEVRKLAEQSQEAAKKIAELIGEIQKDTDRAVVAMDNGTKEVRNGAEVVNQTGTAFREITGLVTEVSCQVKEISAAMQQMAAGSQRIVESVEEVDNLGKKSADEAQGVSAAAQEQLASMEEIASSSQALSKLSQDLQTEVTRFKL